MPTPMNGHLVFHHADADVGGGRADGGRRDRPVRPHGRGPHALVALAAFAALVAGAITLIALLVSGARLLQGVL
jgi:hypothetical protein